MCLQASGYLYGISLFLTKVSADVRCRSQAMVGVLCRGAATSAGNMDEHCPECLCPFSQTRPI